MFDLLVKISGTSEATLAAAQRDLVTLHNAQLGFTAVLPRPGARPEAVVTANLGGAVALGTTVVGLPRCVTAHDRDLARRLLRELRRSCASGQNSRG